MPDVLYAAQTIELEPQVLYYAPWLVAHGLVVWRTTATHMDVGTKPDRDGRFHAHRVEFSGPYMNEDFFFTVLKQRLAREDARLAATL